MNLRKHWWELARDVILQLKPRRVLDVGVGEGMLWRGYGYNGRHNVRTQGFHMSGLILTPTWCS